MYLCFIDIYRASQIWKGTTLYNNETRPDLGSGLGFLSRRKERSDLSQQVLTTGQSYASLGDARYMVISWFEHGKLASRSSNQENCGCIDLILWLAAVWSTKDVLITMVHYIKLIHSSHNQHRFLGHHHVRQKQRKMKYIMIIQDGAPSR